MKWTPVNFAAGSNCVSKTKCVQLWSETIKLSESRDVKPGIKLTLCFGTDQAGSRVSEGAQDGSDGQTQVLVTRIQRHRGEAKVRQLGGFLRSDLHMRDLKGNQKIMAAQELYSFRKSHWDQGKEMKGKGGDKVGNKNKERTQNEREENWNVEERKAMQGGINYDIWERKQRFQEWRDKEREIKRGMDETKKRFYGSNRKFDPLALIRLWHLLSIEAFVQKKWKHSEVLIISDIRRVFVFTSTQQQHSYLFF